MNNLLVAELIGNGPAAHGTARHPPLKLETLLKDADERIAVEET